LRLTPAVAQIMLNLDKAHAILDEMIMNGQIVETNRALVLQPIHMLEQAASNKQP
jgi:hypothetical protein